MKHEPVRRRRPTNVSLPEELVEQARGLNVNVSKACAAGLASAVREADIRRWQQDHKDRVEAFAAWFEENGLPFADLRVF